MKALISAALIVVCAQATSIAQKSPIKFGSIPMEDMTMKVYDKDSSAAAVVLCDYGEAYLQLSNIDVKLNFERHIRIKILKKEGLSEADRQIFLRQSGGNEERVVSLKAVTYTLENGKIVETKMSKDAVFKEKYNRNFVIQKLTLPNVKEGSVIEYSYTVTSDFYTYFPNWQFQYHIPVRTSEYWAIIPEFFFYEKYMQGYLQVANYEVKPKSGTDFQSSAHHWVMNDVPAFKEEPYITTEEDYISRINFALSHIQLPQQPTREIMGSWKKLNDELLAAESFGGIIKSSAFLRKQVDEITAGMNDPMQKLTAIYNYVKQNFEWDGVKDYLALAPKKVYEVKKGSSGDINIMLASMLDKADITVDMVLLSTRDHGFIRQTYPMERQFNYAIVQARVGDKTFLLDATEKMLPMNTLPSRCLNGDALVISATNHGWIKIEAKIKTRTAVSAELAINPDGQLKGKMSIIRDGYDAFWMRKSYTSKGEQEYLKDALDDQSWEVDKTEFQNIKEIDQSAKEIHEVTINEHASAAGDAIYLNPFITGQLESNPFKVEQRTYPVDFGNPNETMYMCKFTIPAGYVIDEMPKSKVFMLPGNAAKYSYSSSQVGNVVSIVSSFQINKSLFIQDEYPNLREFYNQVIAKQAEQIVLKKQP